VRQLEVSSAVSFLPEVFLFRFWLEEQLNLSAYVQISSLLSGCFSSTVQLSS
jgi:hypothetical protein